LLPEASDLSGQVIILSYRPVFTGPYSCIYRGKLRGDGQIVAIKVLNAFKGCALHTMQRKLTRERRAWSALNHPNILPLYGFADDDELFQPFGALISPWLQRGDALILISSVSQFMPVRHLWLARMTSGAINSTFIGLRLTLAMSAARRTRVWIILSAMPKQSTRVNIIPKYHLLLPI
ncbi:hypothetical protein M408DRAFT_328305, partial [Serendipita vermifera MAFF 305830]